MRCITVFFVFLADVEAQSNESAAKRASGMEDYVDKLVDVVYHKMAEFVLKALRLHHSTSPSTRFLHGQRPSLPAFFRSVYRPRKSPISVTRSDNSETDAKVHLKIIGGGITGLACAVSATNASQVSRISIFDETEPDDVDARGASSAAAGILHTMTTSGKKMWLGDEGYAATVQLVDLVENVSGRCVVQRGVPLVRVGGFGKKPSSDNVEIRGGLILDPIQYLNGLWEVVQARARSNGQCAHWVCRGVREWSDLDPRPYGLLREVTICAMGAGITKLWNDVEISLPVMMQSAYNVIVERPRSLTRNDALIRGQYVVPNYGGQTWILGSVHSRSSQDNSVAFDSFCEKLEDKGLLHGEYEALATAAVNPISEKKGVKVNGLKSHLGRLPVVARHPTRQDVWAITAMGSRGLLYHAAIAQFVLSAALARNTTHMPQELLFPRVAG